MSQRPVKSTGKGFMLLPPCQYWPSAVTRKCLLGTAPTSRSYATINTLQLQLQTWQFAHPGESEVTRDWDPRGRAHARVLGAINWLVFRV